MLLQNIIFQRIIVNISNERDLFGLFFFFFFKALMCLVLSSDVPYQSFQTNYV